MPRRTIAPATRIIQHRGQFIVYLRLKDITPESYYGWQQRQDLLRHT